MNAGFETKRKAQAECDRLNKASNNATCWVVEDKFYDSESQSYRFSITDLFDVTGYTAVNGAW